MALPLPKLLGNRVACSDVVKCAFDLGDHEVNVYQVLNDMGPCKVDAVAVQVGRDPSVVYRNLQKLTSCGIVNRTKQTIAEGGYFFVYEALPREQVKRRLRECIDDWHKQMLGAVQRL